MMRKRRRKSFRLCFRRTETATAMHSLMNHPVSRVILLSFPLLEFLWPTTVLGMPSSSELCCAHAEFMRVTRMLIYWVPRVSALKVMWVSMIPLALTNNSLYIMEQVEWRAFRQPASRVYRVINSRCTVTFRMMVCLSGTAP